MQLQDSPSTPSRTGARKRGPSGPPNNTPATMSVGALTHALIAEHAHLVHEGRTDQTVRILVDESAQALAPDRTKPAARLLVAQAASCARRYLTGYAPRSPWTLLGTEVRLGTQRADVVWVDESGLILIDEIKTSMIASKVDPAWLRQAETYISGARVAYGPRVLGARIVTVGAHRLITLVGADYRRIPLDPTPANPLRVRRSDS